ncbi:MAG: enediyne biosynthesis protein [Actinomycetota bacterium]|nr:enediyne biosynthesis protein [Actinomycetota bacterium]
MTTEALAPIPARSVRIAGRQYPLVLPTLRDPRLHLAAVIVSLQVLGQTVLGFELSIAQIAVSILTCAALEVGLTLWRRRVLMWPASALLTGNGVAFILRVPGTVHGDWWSLRGAGIFAGAAAISLLSKYVIRVGDRHVFNPSNFGLVAVFGLLGTRLVNPQDLWWGPVSPGLVLTLAVIVTGGLVIVSRLRMLGLVAAFWLTFAACTGLLALSGHCMTARWHVGQVCGGSFWSVLALSPEILVFMFFMITDPKTTPTGKLARAVYGGCVAFVAALLLAPARTEFSTKVGVLAGLAVVCAARPLVERLVAARGSRIRVPAFAVLVVVVMGGGLLFVAGVRARPAGAVARPVAGERFVAPAAAIPQVAIDPGVQRIAASITQQSAQAMGQDVAGDLAAKGSAVYVFDQMTVVLVRNPLRPQDAPRIGMAVRGTKNGAPYGATLVLDPQPGGHYAIGSELAS